MRHKEIFFAFDLYKKFTTQWLIESAKLLNQSVEDTLINVNNWLATEFLSYMFVITKSLGLIVRGFVDSKAFSYSII
jgi:hypothetical protein